MIKIEIMNPCSCVKKRKSWSKELLFDSLDEAQKVASEMCEQGNTKFCKKHTFEARVDSETVIIDRVKA